MTSKKAVVKSVLLGLLICAVMGMIFAFSAQPAVDSDALSDGLIAGTVRLFLSHSQNLSQAEIDRICTTYSNFVRKCAHFTEYAALGFLCLLFLDSLSALSFSIDENKPSVLFGRSRTSGAARCSVSILLCAVYAATDEIHQYFVPERACRAYDVMIDTLGSAVGVLIAFVILNIIQKSTSHR